MQENSNTTIKIKDLKKIALQHDATYLLSAIEAAQSVDKQKMRSLGVTNRKFLQTALFIEAILPKYIQRKHFYLTKEQTALPFSIEYDPETQNVFIILDENPKTHIGSGANKIVTKAILYNRNKSEIVARGLQTRVRKTELAMMNTFRSTPGIMEVLACTKYKVSGITYRAIYSKLYNAGSLSTAFKAKHRFSLYEKMKIALNILHGLKELHAKDIAHFDIAGTNCLIEIPPGKPGKRNVVAVLADLGRANSITTQLKKTKVQGHPPYIPPEGVFTDKMKGKDYFYSDIYATGCIFYKLFYNKPAPWQDAKYIKNKTLSKYVIHRRLVERIQRYTAACRDYLDLRVTQVNEIGPLSNSEAFEHLILRMVHPDPYKRGTAAELHQELEEIIAEIQF